MTIELAKKEDEYISIKETATLLGVSTKTIRRKIQSGEIKAELRDSPHGQMYYIAKSQISPGRQVVDISTIKREYTVKELAIALASYLKERDKHLVETMEIVESKVDNIVKWQNEYYTNMDTRFNKIIDAAEKRDLDIVERMRDILEKKKKKKWWLW